ncbi:MAG: CHAD domain-containing protein [Chitinophagaceae bacterium]
MDKYQIKHITNNLYRKLKKHVKNVAEDFDVEAIHQFRVEYKKLRAFLRMLSQQEEEAGEINISKTLKKAYTISGSVRDLQLQQPRMEEATRQEQKKPQAYFILLQKEIEKLKPELSEILSDNPVNGSKKKTDAAIPNEFSLDSFKNFVQQKWAAVYAIIRSGHFSDDNVHEIRKNLKDLFYNVKPYKGTEYEILSVSILKGKDEKYFTRLLEELGSFQDRCVAIALLKSYWIVSLNTYNRELLDRVKKMWLKDKLRMKQLLVKKMKAEIAWQAAVHHIISSKRY